METPATGENGMQILTEMIKALEALDGVLEAPSNRVEEGETVLGVLPTDLRPLWILLSSLVKRVEARAPEKLNLKEFGEKERKQLIQELVNLRTLFDLAHVTFHSEIERQFPEVAMSEAPFGLQEGWQVVSCPPDPVPFPTISIGFSPHPIHHPTTPITA